MYRAGVRPFSRARDALELLLDEKKTEEEGLNGQANSTKKAKTTKKAAKSLDIKAKKEDEEDLLSLCNIVMGEVLNLSDNFVGGGGVRVIALPPFEKREK